MLNAPSGYSNVNVPEVWMSVRVCQPLSHILFSIIVYIYIYLVLFHLLPPYHLDVPCYLNNRQRYCSVWSERLGLITMRIHSKSSRAPQASFCTSQAWWCTQPIQNASMMPLLNLSLVCV